MLTHTIQEMQEQEFQVSLGWLEVTAVSANGSSKLLISPNGENEPISVLEKRTLSLVPNLEPAQDGDRISFVDLKIVMRFLALPAFLHIFLISFPSPPPHF